jgi:hypothetical protein
MNKFATSDFQGKDPFGPWPRWRKILWLAITVAIVIWRGPGFIESLRPKGYFLRDFFQEWSSSRNLLQGKSIYQPLDRMVGLYLKTDPESLKGKYINSNTHPPTSVILLSPFGLLDYLDAIFIWNILSLILLIGTLRIVSTKLRLAPSPWSMLVIVCLLLVSNPFRIQMNHGQLNIAILFLIVCAWAFDRSGRVCFAGAAIAIATMIKIIPAFLLLYFVLMRRWISLLVALLTILVVTSITVVIIGFPAFIDYFNSIVPEASLMAGGWGNASLDGWWRKLFFFRKCCRPDPSLNTIQAC